MKTPSEIFNHAEEYFKKSNAKGYETLKNRRQMPVFSFDTMLKFTAMYVCENQNPASDYHSFVKYLNDNYEYFDNIDIGDVYKSKNGDGISTENDIVEEWINNKKELNE